MDKDVDVLLEFCRKGWDEVRHLEDQRATIANMVILISSAVVGLFVTQERTADLFPLSWIVLLVGLYGLVATAKLYERYLFELSRFSRLIARLDEINPALELSSLRKTAEVDHVARHALMYKVPLNQIWMLLHWGIVAVGSGLAIASWP